MSEPKDYDALQAVIAWLNEKGDAPAYSVPPKTRSGAHYTVELTGGTARDLRQTPLVAIQSWADDEATAYRNLLHVQNLILMRDWPHGVTSMLVNTALYKFPDVGGYPRYQLAAEVTAPAVV